MKISIIFQILNKCNDSKEYSNKKIKKYFLYQYFKESFFENFNFPHFLYYPIYIR